MTEFLAENDARLARALYSVWSSRRTESNIGDGLRLFDRLSAIEVRTKGAAAEPLHRLYDWLSENGIERHDRATEVGEFVAGIPRFRSAEPSPSRSKEEKLTVVEEPAASGRVSGYSSLIRPAAEIRSDPNQAPWEAIPEDRFVALTDQLSPVDGEHPMDPESTIASSVSLPWYDAATLIRMTDPNWGVENLVVYLVELDGSLYRLAGTSPPIHEINSKAPIRITEDNVLDYLEFFCFFVRGEEGPFFVLESDEDPWLPDAMDPDFASAISGTAAPAEYIGRNATGYFRCDATIFYSNALFRAEFEVYPNGFVEMLDDDPIHADLAERIEAPII